MTLTGHDFTDALLPTASDLVWAVKTGDHDAISRAVAAVEQVPLGLRGLVVVLAAMLPDDQSPSDLLSWRLDPDRYLALRERGLDSLTAMAVVRSESTRAA